MEPGSAESESDDESLPGVVRLRRCPLLELSRRYPDVVCSIHRGLLRGAARAQAAESEVDLQPFAEVGACLAQVPDPAPSEDETGDGPAEQPA